MIERVPFGRTGHLSSRVIFGAAALWSMSQERADAIFEVLDEFGINHLDTAAQYGDSELRLAPLLKKRRNDFFLATKAGDRDGTTARQSLERSLERLGVDQVDLIQLHNLVEPDEWETAHGPDGALAALIKARDEGLVRFIGVTGHGLRIAGMHLRSLGQHDYDSVLLPYNYALLQAPAYRADVESLLEVCEERSVGVQTIKSVARRRWQEGDESRRHSWYEPLRDEGAIGRAVRYVMGNRHLFLNTSSDGTVLRTILGAADTPGATPTDADMEADIDAHDIKPIFDGADLERI